MKKLLSPMGLLLTASAAGVAGLLLRIRLFAVGTDEKGFVIPGHPADILLWCFSGAVLLLLLLCAGKCTDNTEDPHRLPAAIAGMVGSILGAMGIALSAMAELTLHNDILTKLAFGLAIAAAAALLAVAYCRSKALRPNVLLHAVIAVYLLFRLINQYRHWSSDPQLQDYCFQLLATVFVMLAAYHRGAFDVGIGKHRPYIFFHLAAVFCCFLSLTDKACIAFYIGCGIWMMTDLIPASVPDVPQEES